MNYENCWILLITMKTQLLIIIILTLRLNDKTTYIYDGELFKVTGHSKIKFL